MVAPSPLPQQRPIQKSGQKARMKDVVVVGFEVGKFEVENQAKFEQLQRDRDSVGQIALATGATAIGAVAALMIVTTLPFAAIASIPALWKIAEALSSLSQRYFLMPELIEAFEDEDVAIEVGLKPEGTSEIDFFLRFPDKEFVLLNIRAVGKSRVNFSLSKQALQSRRKQGGLKTIKPNPIVELLEQERWIRNYRTELLGSSSRDKRRQMAKVVVFWDEPEIASHPEQMYVTINDQKYLYVTTETNGSAFVIKREQVVDFIRGYLASRRSRKAS